MRARHAVHPLLLEPTYWRSRLQRLALERPRPWITPRPDLSAPGMEVLEFRIRAHDGERLRGLFARPAWQPGSWPARLRVLTPAPLLATGIGRGIRPGADRGATPLVDDPTLEETIGEEVDAVRHGTAFFVLQAPPDRRLEDRVLDVVRLCHLAQDTRGVDRKRLSFTTPDEGRTPDELLIAEQLFAGRFV